MQDGIQILAFYLLNDKMSKNTIMILEFLDKNIRIINNSGFKVKFNLIKKEDTQNSKFMDFIKKNNIGNIPCIINETNNEVISGVDDIFKLLSLITDIVNNNNNDKKYVDISGLDEDERFNMYTQDYIYAEMARDDKQDDRFEEEDNKKDLADKLRAFEKQRKGCTGKNNENGSGSGNGSGNGSGSGSGDENDYADDFEAKVLNKVNTIKRRRDFDEDSLTKQLLDKMEDIEI
jgi:hypothetical protein